MSEAPRKIRVLVADDENLFRHALANLLALAPDIVVVGEAASAAAWAEGRAMTLEQAIEYALAGESI